MLCSNNEHASCFGDFSHIYYIAVQIFIIVIIVNTFEKKVLGNVIGHVCDKQTT